MPTSQSRHCEQRGDEATHFLTAALDCFASARNDERKQRKRNADRRFFQPAARPRAQQSTHAYRRPTAAELRGFAA
jgi:hypothetical protein